MAKLDKEFSIHLFLTNDWEKREQIIVTSPLTGEIYTSIEEMWKNEISYSAEIMPEENSCCICPYFKEVPDDYPISKKFIERDCDFCKLDSCKNCDNYPSYY